MDFQIEAQIKGWKNKLHFVEAETVEEALRIARDFFGDGWVYKLTDMGNGEVVFQDEAFDPTWQEK